MALQIEEVRHDIMKRRRMNIPRNKMSQQKLYTEDSIRNVQELFSLAEENANKPEEATP